MIPMFAKKKGSIVGKSNGDPSAPPPLHQRQRTKYEITKICLPEFTLSGQRRRESDGVVESKTECFVNLFTADVVEDIIQQIVSD